MMKYKLIILNYSTWYPELGLKCYLTLVCFSTWLLGVQETPLFLLPPSPKSY